jgi:hypothetical protein
MGSVWMGGAAFCFQIQSWFAESVSLFWGVLGRVDRLDTASCPADGMFQSCRAWLLWEMQSSLTSWPVQHLCPDPGIM